MRAEKEINKKILFVLWLCFTIFVVYGSLVPLNFRFIPFSDALDKFLQIPYLTLGIESREDWIANLLIYIPISFGAALLLISDRMSLTIKSISCFIIACYCACLAVIVEFIQLYFPGRTVSLNDIIAEVIGSFLGAVIFLCFGEQIKALISKVKLRGLRAIQGFLTIYVIWYLAYSLFPFDFLISLEEVKNKFLSDSWSFFIIKSRVHEGEVSVILSSIVEILSIAPIGYLFYISNVCNKKNLFKILCFGIIGGLILECVQFFLASGISQGMSALLKAVGFICGYSFGRWSATQVNKKLPYSWIQRGSALCFIPYLALLVLIIWVRKGEFLPVDVALDRIHTIIFIPFYYHYWSRESTALFSLVSYFVIYFPVGLLTFGLLISKRMDKLKRSIFLSVLLGFIFSGFFEMGKLFFNNTIIDLTNILIGVFGAVLGSLFAFWLVKQIHYLKIDIQSQEERI